jgi:hypothetical protein
MFGIAFSGFKTIDTACNHLYSNRQPVFANNALPYYQLKQPLTKDTVNFTGPGVNGISEIDRIALNKDLQHIKKQGIKYFLDQRLPNGLVLDRASNLREKESIDGPLMASIAATGYGLSALVMAVEEKMIPEKEAARMVLDTLKFVDKVTPEINGGWLAHFMEPETGKIYKDTEVSTIDTALFFFNAFIAAEYFGGEVKQQVEKMYDRIDFDLVLSDSTKKPGEKAFNLGFKIKDGKREMIPYVWDEYSEGILVPLLSLGNKNVSERLWSEGWDRSKKWQVGKKSGFVNLPLFTYFYPNGLLNLKDQTDCKNDNYWQAFKTAIDFQKRFCEFTGYPVGLFGLTACDGPGGYCVYSAYEDDKNAFHDGTIAPPAILAALPVDEKSAIDAYKILKNEFIFDEKYGISNAYCTLTGWKSDDAVGIDIGSMLLMINAYEDGLIHKLSDQNEIVKRIKERAGFKKL